MCKVSLAIKISSGAAVSCTVRNVDGERVNVVDGRLGRSDGWLLGWMEEGQLFSFGGCLRDEGRLDRIRAPE